MAVGRDEIVMMEVRLRDFMTKELKRLGLQTQKTQRTASSSFRKMGRSAGRMALKLGRVTAAMTGLGAGLGGLIVLFVKARQGMKEAAEFSMAMAEVGTISEGVAGNIEHFSRAVLDLSTAFGQNELKTAKALYQTISAGITDTAEALYLVERAAELAVGGFAEINVVVDFLTGVINAYGKSVYEAAELNNIFFETVRVGKTTIPEMAKQMGAVMPIAANLGVTIEELSAMLATLTLGNIETSLATTYMRQALVAVLQPTQEAQELMAATGLEFTQSTIKAEGFVGLLRRMRDEFKGNIVQMQKFFPNVRSFIPVLALAGKQWEKFLEVSEAIASVNENRLNPTMRALETAMLSAGKKMQVLGNAARQGFMMLGAGLIEAITGPIGSVKELQDLAFVFRDAIASLKPIVEGFAALLIGAAGAAAWAFAQLAPKMADTDAQALVMEQDLGNLSKALFTMARSVMGGGVGIGEAFADMTHTLKSGRKELVVEAVEARDALNQLRDLISEDPRGGAFGFDVTDELADMLIKDIPQKVIDAAPTLENAMREYWAQGAAGADLMERTFSEIIRWGAENLEGAFMFKDKGIRAATWADFVAHQINTEVKQLQVTYEAAAFRLGRTLGRGDEELADLLSFHDVLDLATRDFATNRAAWEKAIEYGVDPTLAVVMPDWTDPSGLFDQIMKVMKAGGAESAEGFATALAINMKDYLSTVPGEVRDVIAPKFEQAMAYVASKGGEKYANIIKGIVSGIDYGDYIPTDESRMIFLTTSMYNYNQELERQKMIMPDWTEEERAKKKLYTIETQRAIALFAVEKVVRETTASQYLLKQSLEAVNAAYDRQAEKARIAAYFAIQQRDLGKEKALVDLMPAFTPEQVMAKELEAARINMETASAQAEQAFQTLQLSGGEYMVLLDAIDQNYQETVDGIINGTEQIGFAWQALEREAQNLDAEFEQIKVHAVNMLVDGLAEGMMKMAEGADGASASWKEFSRSFLRTIAVMIIRAYMLQAVMTALKFFGAPGAGGAPGPDMSWADAPGGGLDLPNAKGNAFAGGLGPVHAFAQGGMVPGGLGRMLPVGAYQSGGVVSQPSWAVMGEGGRPEAILPLERMAGGDLGVKAGGGGGTNINISINAVDAKSVDELLVSRQDTLRNIIRQAMTESRAFRSTMLGQTAG